MKSNLIATQNKYFPEEFNQQGNILRPDLEKRKTQEYML